MYLDESFRLKVGLAEMLKGGVIMDVTNAEQAVIAEKAGAIAVMALERVPADIRKEGGVARMAPISKIREIMHEVSIPVMAKARIGHFMEARILEALGVDYIDESEVLTPADEEHHIDKRDYKVPFVCGARNLGEALRRIAEGAAMIRTKGEAGSGNIVEAVRHIRTIVKEMKQLTVLGPEELVAESKKHQAPLELIQYVAKNGKLPVPNFSAGGIATPADAALVMQLGAEAVFVGSGIFKSADPEVRARGDRESGHLLQRSGKAAGSERGAGRRPCSESISPSWTNPNCCRLEAGNGCGESRQEEDRRAGAARRFRSACQSSGARRCGARGSAVRRGSAESGRTGDPRRRKHHHVEAAAGRGSAGSVARVRPSAADLWNLRRRYFVGFRMSRIRISRRSD